MEKGINVALIKLVSLLIIFVLGNNSISAQSYNEILGRPTDSSITTSILSTQQIDVYWEYGTVPGLYPYTTSLVTVLKDIPYEFDFTGLQPDTKYYYRTRYRISGSAASYSTGIEHIFHTQRSKGSTFSFTIEADEHLYDKKGVRSLYQICLANQAADNPDFMLSLGDIFGDDHYPNTITSSQMDLLHKDYRQYLGQICHSVPFYVCLGNHEGEFDYYLARNPPNNIAVYATLSRKFYYPNPYPNDFYCGNKDIEPYGMGNPENYYAWTWGDALFVVLDAYRDQCDTSAKPTNWNWSLGLPQYTWLKNTLESSTAKYKFVFAHHVRGQGRGGITNAKLFEWGGYEQNGTTYSFTKNRPGWEKPIHQLFVDNGVNIFFQGHDHLFVHEVLDGVTYQEVPMPSDSTYEIGMLANAKAYVSDTFDGSGHLKVTVAPEGVKVDFVRAYLPADEVSGIHHNREVAFSYSVVGSPVTGMDENNLDKTVSAYPNPAKDKLSVSLPEGIRDFRIRLINMVGKVVLESDKAIMDVSSLKKGIYILNLKSKNYTLNNKIIIE
jgi:hypothetical protein